MVYNLILQIVLLLNLQAAAPSTLDCNKFKEGKFSSLNAHKKDLLVSIVRSANKQTEYRETTGVTVELAVTWTSDCSYYLEYISSSDDVSKHLPGRKIFVDIIEIDGDMYKFSAKVEGFKDAPLVFGWIRKDS